MGVNSLARLTIPQGSDKSAIIKLRRKKDSDPYDLTSATNIEVIFKNRDRTELVLDMTTRTAVKASETYESVIYSAVTAGAIGNGIYLTFNGVDTIATIISDWNLANPTNTVTSNAADDTVVPVSGAVRLTSGYDAYSPISIVGSPQLGKIQITMLEKETNFLKRGPSQSIKIVIDDGQHPGGKRNVGHFRNRLDVVDED